jgi:hypothetical protein
LGQLRQNSRSSSGEVTYLRQYLRVGREEQIDPGSEADDSHPVSLMDGFADLAVSHDSPGYQSRDLTDEDAT